MTVPSAATLTPLRPGDLVAVVAPADWLDDALLAAGRARLEAHGFRVLVHPQNALRRGRLAGPDAARLSALREVLADPAVRAVFCARGGYGAGRLLDGLDYAAIAADPKPVIGYSDITALLNAIQRHAGVVTVHGPVLKEIAAGENPVGTEILFELLAGRWPQDLVDRLLAGATVLRPGTARAPLIGGNLTLIHALIGTRHDIDPRGRILFLEDWREPLYHLDRMLFHLRQVGKFDGIAGLLVGAIAEIDERPAHIGGTIDELLADHFRDAPFPVATNLEIGHGNDKVPLPLGAMAEMQAGDGGLRLVVSPAAA